MTETAVKKVKFSFALNLKTGKDYEALPGTAAWAMNMLAHPATYLKVGTSTKGRLCVWLFYEQGLPGGAAGMVSECLAKRDADYEGDIAIDCWPLEAYTDSSADFLEVNGIFLTPGGEAVFRQLGKKARTLLRAAIRKGDAEKGPVKLKLSAG